MGSKICMGNGQVAPAMIVEKLVYPVDHGGKYSVKIIDYDGTILQQDHLNTGDVFTLPTPPIHERLTFQEWSSNCQIENNTITVGKTDIIVGPIYTTTSGLTEFDITLTSSTGLNVICYMSGQKDWGDGTIDSLTSHTYSNYGDYIITCDGSYISSSNFGNKTIYFCTALRIGKNVTGIGVDAFRICCKNIKTVTIPNTLTTNACSEGLFTGNKLRALVIPSSITDIKDFSVSGNYYLKDIVLPYGLTKINYQLFYNCTALEELLIPDTVTVFDNQAISSTSYLSRIVMPKNITTINTNFPSQLIECDFSNAISIPTIRANAFNNHNPLLKIKVPANLYNDWIIAENWSTYADCIEAV